VVGVQAQQAADAFALFGARNEHRLALFQRTGVDPDKGQVAEGRTDNLERESGQRLAGVGTTRFGFLGLGMGAFDIRYIERRRQEGDDRVDQQLDAFVHQRGTAEHRDQVTGNGGRTQHRHQIGGGQVGVVHVFFQQRLVEFGEHFNQLIARLFGGGGELGGDLVRADGLAVFTGEAVRFHGQQIDHALELLLAADRQLQGDRIDAEAFAHLFDRRRHCRAGAVHLVDEGEGRHFVAAGLAPDGFGLRLHSTNGAENTNGPVEYS